MARSKKMKLESGQQSLSKYLVTLSPVSTNRVRTQVRSAFRLKKKNVVLNREEPSTPSEDNLGDKFVIGREHDRVGHAALACLRVFDHCAEYGPSLGMSRLFRWDRANTLGLSPPLQVKPCLVDGRTF
ncbi:hypothetical protein F5051DRAFT_406465 [Lentinula edodes]|nr:hypothetical protein F5051DRAFT_406465 [Lentinula edodes]